MKKLTTLDQQDPIVNLYQQQMVEATEKPWLASMMLQQAKQLFERFVTYYKQLASLSRQTRRRLQKKLSLSLAGTALILALSNAPSAYAGTILVDGTICTLDNAVQSANTDTAVGGCTTGAGADTLDLQNDITLAVYTPHVTSIITVEGNGHTIDGNDNRHFSVDNGGDLTINDTILTGNTIGSFSGGAIRSAIANGQTATVTLNNSTISGNSAPSGGGIYIDNYGTMTVTLNNSTISGNSVTRDGGGIYVRSYYSNATTVTLNNSTISGNSATNDGGGIYTYNQGGTMTVTLNNSTISGNSATSDGGGINNGYGTTITLNRSVISGNTATGSGPEIYNDSGSGTVTGSNFNVIGHSGTANTYGFIPSGTDVVPMGALNTVLDVLADNGGPTFTHALILGSDAIDRVPTLDAACDPGVTTDQRGAVRASGVNRGGPACDAGAFEYASNETPTAVTLESLSASTTTPTGVAALSGLLASIGAGALFWRKRTKHPLHTQER